MSTDLVARHAHDALVTKDPIERIFRSWLSTKRPGTISAYTADVLNLAAYLGHSTIGAALRDLAQRGPVDARVALMDWVAHQADAHQHATVRRRAAAANQFLRLMHEAGECPFLLRVQVGPDDTPSGLETKVSFEKMRAIWRRILLNIERAAATGDPRDVRDCALLLAMHDSALRRSEATSPDVAHVDLEDRKMLISAKGRRKRVAVPLSERSVASMRRWLEIRGSAPGPLFCAVSRSGSIQIRRLTTEAVRLILARISSGVGMVLRPHDLRRLAITRALELTGGDTPAVMQLSRHADLSTLQIYDLRRRAPSRALVDMISKEDS